MNKHWCRHAAALVVGTLMAAVVVGVGTPAQAADSIADGQWYLNYLNVVAAHRLSQGEGVRIGVVDTGIDPHHPDIEGSVEPGVDVNFGGNGDGLEDTDGHGTAMASLIVGHGKIKGIAPKAKVVSLRYADGLTSSPTHMGEAIRWAVDHELKVISISAAHVDDDLVLQQAIEDAVARDIVIVAGSGNKSQQTGLQYPAAYAGVVAVGGIGRNGQLWSGSITGPEVAVAAPAERISVAYRGNRRVIVDGTSNSTALVAGVVALIRAKFPSMPAAEVVRRLTGTATDKGPAGRDSMYGFGVPNLVAALSEPYVGAPSATKGAVTPSAAGPTWIAAPGAEFPLWTVLVVGAGCLLVVLAAGLVIMLVRRRTVG
ncbi:S8 family serine peptidase [Catellatospora sp. KI3]|uniref:S8 family serine peptidase n=1 Tax=Catellatospora sp. KI3 TaxID=3041620 RepID=UPI0024821F07|nr:S8 family serine peptidase [Catellatospora sp. KI3]MDI1465882.1 S8 family serine peptidase [Catellatospora sp. KI3]